MVLAGGGPWRRGIIGGMVLALAGGLLINGLLHPLPSGLFDYGSR
jgi:hypothetical protein